MKPKVKFDENSTLDDAKRELDVFLELGSPTINLNKLRKILRFLNVEEIGSTGGSAIRFRHEILVNDTNYKDGCFSIHKIHKGGNQEEIYVKNYKIFLYPHLIKIINKLKSNDV